VNVVVRPKIAEFSLRVFGRPVHPELFQVIRSRRIERECYTAKLDVTTDGHVITFQSDKVTLVEIASATQRQLPSGRQLHCHRIDAEQTASADLHNRFYRSQSSIERVSPNLFFNVQQMLPGEESPDALFHSFQASGRMAFGGISVLLIEARQRRLTIRACHTFPDDYAVLSVQTEFQLH
jgi:hypothetical protein